ncbi:hypothetical protein ITP53_33610 [Nonomuraea sp. K274]|uniref:Secreted protein n=1 Tax=Nonomuraea cypriaca TaxID=1187855 RepID=A0A931F3X5_9ACTN|nr:hypothetical protein [Nonomuraea cypriaca]MBF8190566.1 hypothetical protein [Nonomuraea cypriaca]
MLKKIFAGVAVVAAASAASVATANSASAQAPLTHTVHVTGNYDTGSHGPWARLDFDRTVRITAGGPTKMDWEVRLTDKGTFRTLAGKKSPKGGATLGRVDGSFTGTFEFKVKSATKPTAASVRSGYNFRCNMDGSGNRETDCPGMPAPTSTWPSLYFGQGATVTAGNWLWDYRAPCERWVNSLSGDVGEITGKGCAKPATPAAPVVKQPTCSNPSGHVKVRDVRGVDYKLFTAATENTTPLTPGGWKSVAKGTYLVQTALEDGYKYAAGAKKWWKVVIKPARGCTR